MLDFEKRRYHFANESDPASPAAPFTPPASRSLLGAPDRRLYRGGCHGRALRVEQPTRQVGR